MNGGPWTDADDQLLKDLAVEGLTVPQIAARLGRTAGAVGGRMHRTGITFAAIRAKGDGMKVRPCLCCGMTFVSEGAHNRMCDRCRTLTDDTHSILSGGR